ncbi:MAG: hypothetical protein AAF604_05330 [Acidobacteriota bacterium]
MPAIFHAVSNWHGPAGGIHHLVHAITRPLAAIPLVYVHAFGDGGGNHSTTDYWRGIVAVAVARAGGPKAILRVEIDSTPMPGGGRLDGCLLQVPRLLRRVGLPELPLRFFSHRDHRQRAASRTQNCYYSCNTSDDLAGLIHAFGRQREWHWVTWAGQYP